MSKKYLIPIIIIAITVLLAAGVYWYVTKSHSNNVVVCTQDAKQCLDGSYVSRSGPKCEFASCPEVKDETADWKTYRNKKYRFEIKYPIDWKIEDNIGVAIGAVLIADVFSSQNNRILNIIAAERVNEQSLNVSGGESTKKEFFKVDGFDAMKENYNNSFIRTSIALKNNFILFAITAEEEMKSTISKNDELIIDQIVSTFKFTK